ncbi:hypothetical protein I7I51_06237, partial [Histoplasma capsulatum]
LKHPYIFIGLVWHIVGEISSATIQVFQPFPKQQSMVAGKRPRAVSNATFPNLLAVAPTRVDDDDDDDDDGNGNSSAPVLRKKIQIEHLSLASVRYVFGPLGNAAPPIRAR